MCGVLKKKEVCSKQFCSKQFCSKKLLSISYEHMDIFGILAINTMESIEFISTTK